MNAPRVDPYAISVAPHKEDNEDMVDEEIDQGQKPSSLSEDKVANREGKDKGIIGPRDNG